MSIETKNRSSTQETQLLEKAQLVWDEYKYRHEHCWKLIFQTTAAVVAIAIVPFTNREIASSLGYWILALPTLGLILTLFALRRMNKELALLDVVRQRHRDLQGQLQGISYIERHSTFSRDIKLYFSALAILSVLDIIAITFVWIPTFK